MPARDLGGGDLNPQRSHGERMVNQLGFLDGIRGLMALWVLASHLIQRSGGPQNFLIKGGIAVDVFMLVSGVLMAHNFYRREHKEPLRDPHTWIRFYIRRFFRIAPLYYLLFLIAFLFSAPLAEMAKELGGSHSAGQTQDRSVLLNWLTHLTFTFGLFPSWSSSNTLPDWSLSLEMQFYAFFPLMLALMRTSVLTFFLISIVAYHLANHYICVYQALPNGCFFYPQPSMLALKISCFAAGMLMVQMATSQEKIKKVMIAVCFFILVLYQQRLTFTALAICLALIYYFSATPGQPSLAQSASRLANRVLGSGPFKFLGDISYSVYLSHFLVLFPILSLAKSMGWLELDSPWARFLIACLLVAPPTVLLSWMLYKFVEVPFINYARKLTEAPRLKKIDIAPARGNS